MQDTKQAKIYRNCAEKGKIPMCRAVTQKGPYVRIAN